MRFGLGWVCFAFSYLKVITNQDIIFTSLFAVQDKTECNGLWAKAGRRASHTYAPSVSL